MKIGLVTGEYPPMEGGVGAFTQELAQALFLLGHQIHIITKRDAWPTDIPKTAKNLREPINLTFAQLHPNIRHWRWSALHQVVSLVERYEFDLINIQYQAAAFNMRSPSANLMPWRFKHICPTVVTFHDLRVPYLFPKAGRLRETAVNFMAKQANGVIVTNPQDLNALQQKRIGVERLIQIPIGSNITARNVLPAEMQAVRAELNLGANDLLLGYFGFLNETKGADTLLQALSKLPANIHLVFIGGRTGTSDAMNNQQFFEQLDQMIIDLNLSERVHWTGFVEDHHVSTYLQTADLMVMPYKDGVSLRRGTLMAALAHGRPLISTTPSVPTPELAHNQNIWLVPPDDVTSLANAIETVLTDQNLQTKLGKGAKAVADLFTWDKIAQQTADFYKIMKDEG